MATPIGDRVGGLVTLERDSAKSPVLVVAPLGETDDYPHGGIFTRRQINSVRRLGIRCDVMIVEGWRNPLAYVIVATSLARMSRGGRHRYALIHAHGGETALVATAYRGAPLLVSYLGDDVLGHPRGDGHVPLSRAIRSVIIRQHSRLTAATITKSTPMEGLLPPSVRVHNHVIPNGVDLELFRPRDRNTARAHLGWDPDERVILYVSDPSVPCKRFPLAKQVSDRVASKLNRVRLHAAYGLRPEAMPPLMNASDCLLVTSASEGSPNIVKEALASNLPIVATPVGDIPERLMGVEKCFVRPPDIDQLAAAVIECLEPPARSNGRERGAAPDERRIAEQVASVYAEIVGERVLRG